MNSFKTIEWKNNRVLMIDQRKLPSEEVYIECATFEEVAECIRKLVIRGAPAIGIAAAMGMALGGPRYQQRLLLRRIRRAHEDHIKASGHDATDGRKSVLGYQ